MIWRRVRLTSTDVHQQPCLLAVQFEGNSIGVCEKFFIFSTVGKSFNSLPAYNSLTISVG